MSPAVLVPRPETELVVEAALALPLAREARVLDVGTGSGCLAVTLAAERPRWRVTGVDRSLAALEVARANASRHAPGVRFGCADLTTAVAPPWDLVVANLPYIPTPAIDALPVEVRRDPAAALDGGPDGLDLVRRLLSDLSRVLRVCGGAILELGEDQAEAVAAAARADGLERRAPDPRPRRLRAGSGARAPLRAVLLGNGSGCGLMAYGLTLLNGTLKPADS